MLIHPPGH